MPFVRLSILLLLIPAGIASAQHSTLGPSLTVMGGESREIRGGCGGGDHIGAFGLHYSTPVVGKAVILQLVGRAYWIKSPVSCQYVALLPPPPPADGTYDVEQRSPLQSVPFVTTDVRIGLRVPGDFVMLSAGGGTALRDGHDAPYWVAGVGVPFIDGRHSRFGVQVEYHWIRVTNGLFRRTYLNGQMTAEQSIGSVHHWTHAIAVGIRFGMPL